MNSPEPPSRRGVSRVVVVGAGSAGALMAREIRRESGLRLEVVAFVDDDEAKLGARVEDVVVMGPIRDLGRIAEAQHADLVVLALPSAPGEAVRAVTALCRTLALPLRTVPSLSEILRGVVRVSAIRDIEVADLLRRKPARPDPNAGRYLSGATVLVTGAGGTIGSELCHQILSHQPERLILLDVSEVALYDVDRRLRKIETRTGIVPVIGNIRDPAAMRRVLGAHRPSVVFHAAAYKHIPLTESNEAEAVLNIAFGTRNVIEASEEAEVDRFVLISSDKAVEAEGVMGACKRIAELLVREAALRTGRCMVAVRFGNVLGSSGSVVPLFREQIAEGGPVTVRHPDLQRYFMTVHEASSLVVSAAALGEGGEVFVLDMGEPVRILNLAEDLIRLSGLEPGRDIEIAITGLCPGEKLQESLFLGAETAQSTTHSQILVARPSAASSALSPSLLERLEQAAMAGDAIAVRDLLHTIVPSFPPGRRGPRPG